jgi:hypothetical protein
LNTLFDRFRALGFTGCVRSVDWVNIWWEKCRAYLRSSCQGKEHHLTLAYEVVCDHTKRIQAATRGFYGATNDKTIVNFDSYVTTCSIHKTDI